MNIDAALDCLFNIADIKAERVAISSPLQMCVIPLQKYTFICLERSGLNVKCWDILTLFLAFSEIPDSRLTSKRIFALRIGKMLMKMLLSTTDVPKGMCSAINQKSSVGIILLFSCAPQISNKKHYFTHVVN